MSSTASTSQYPIAYFLHSAHAAPKTLHEVLSTPKLLKQRKAWLPGFLAAPNSTVGISPTGIGEWQNEDEIRGVVYYIQNAEQERRLTEHVGGGCKAKEVDFEVCCGGVFGVREWVGGKAFVVSEESAGAGRLEGIREEEEETDAAQVVRASKEEKRKGLLRRITEPLRSRPTSDEPLEVEGSLQKRVGLFRRIKSGLSLATHEPDTGASSSTAGVTEEAICHQDEVVREELPPCLTSAPQIVITDPIESCFDYIPKRDADDGKTSDEEVREDVDVEGKLRTA
jgi:hypothetical protein